MDEEIAEFLKGVVGAVEASSYESLCLWREYHEERGVPWKQHMAGHGRTIGKLDDRPIHLSLMTSEVAGRKVLFYEATSQVVDHEMVRAWLLKALPNVPITNAMNAHIVLNPA